MLSFTRYVCVCFLAISVMATTPSLQAQDHNGRGGDGSHNGFPGSSGGGGGGAQDPGPRAGTVGAGTPLSSLTPAQLQFFQDGLSRFLQVDSVSGQMAGGTGGGLRPRLHFHNFGSFHGEPA